MDDPDLFNVGRKKKRAPKPKSPHAKQIQHIMLRVYYALYCRRYNNEKPLIQAKHWSMLRHLVDTYGPALVEERLRAFFASSDRWIRESSGHTMGAFVSQWQKLAAESNQRNAIQTSGGQPQAPCLHQPTCLNAIAHSRKLVDEMRGTYQSIRPTQSASSRTASTPSDPF